MISKKIKSAVIFDCDGVMFDSRKANINYYNYLLSRFGLPLMTVEKINFVHSHTADESVRYIFEGTPFLEQAMALKAKVDYSPFIRDMVVETGLKELLKSLKPDYGLGIATNRSTTIGNVLRYHDLNSFFDVVVSSLDVKNPKPHPESLLKILDFFNIRPTKAFYIGDSHLDCQSARSAGVIFIAYKNRELEADYHVNSMNDILEVVKTRKESDG